jgi:hypothetical protein
LDSDIYPTTATKEEGKINLLSFLICGHKYEKIKNLFIFEKVQKKFEPIQKEL